MKQLVIGITIFLSIFNTNFAQTNVSKIESPLEVVKLIGDKLIRDTPFKYKLGIAPINTTFQALNCVDFGRTFSLGKPAIAYAYTRLNVAENQIISLQIEHNDGCKIWVNGKEVYQKNGNHKISILHDERSFELPNEIKISLQKGYNDLLIKSETGGEEWRVYLQPPSNKGAILTHEIKHPEIGLKELQDVDNKIVELTNWLVIGPFENKNRKGLEVVFAPEKEIKFGAMYAGLNEKITWTIPKIEILGEMIDSKLWGTNYDWNYHNGGVAWAMQHLTELSGEKKYDDYATKFCDFHINGTPFVDYQVNKLNYVNSANHFIINTPLLDFTLAPSLPFIYRLRKNQTYNNREDYVKLIDKMLKYARFEQIRLPNSSIYTRTTPEKYTTWTDDMFMGIPFLVQASQYALDAESRKVFLDDAANQVVGFSKQVWDSEANLYVHAKYSTKDAKLPHWTRANGWGIWATTEVLMNLPKNHPQYQTIMNQYVKHVEALANWQDKSGFWFNIMDVSDSKKEVSGTAIVTLGIARGINNGWLDAAKYKPVVENAWNALKTEIEPDGTVHKICMGTMCSEDVNYYINRPYFDNDTHGLFAVLFVGMEVEKMFQKKSISGTGK
jgi:unsaturated rhamnogalacturonyl hydrolase